MTNIQKYFKQDMQIERNYDPVEVHKAFEEESVEEYISVSTPNDLKVSSINILTTLADSLFLIRIPRNSSIDQVPLTSVINADSLRV